MEQCLLSYFIRDDEIVNSCDFNPGLLRQGTGIYEVIRIIDGKPLFFEEHINRFLNSAIHEKIDLTLRPSDIKQKIRILVEQNRMQNGNIKYQYNKSENGNGIFLAWIIPSHYPSKSDLVHGVVIKSLNAIRKNPHSKRANLPVREIADKMIAEQIISEVLLVNNDGIITEGSSSNFFFIRENQLVTPRATLVLEGITREKIISLAQSLDIKVCEVQVYYSEVNRFDACFISGTSKSVLPVNQIDDIRFGIDNPLMIKLSDSYNDLVNNYIHAFIW